MKLKKVKIVLSWLLMPVVLLVMLAFNASKKSELSCQSLHVEVNPMQGVYFVTQKDVETKITSRFEDIVGTPLEKIDLWELEQLLLELPHVASAKVYATINGALKVKVNQRKPIVRLAFSDGSGFYLDKNGKVIPLSKNYTARVLVVNGNISRKLMQMGDAAESAQLQSIYEMARLIEENSFLKAQLQQLYVNENQEFEFVPRVGNHIIEFGDRENMVSKFQNLEIFYREGLAYKGWNRYQKISLKYKDQVVCTKK